MNNEEVKNLDWYSGVLGRFSKKILTLQQEGKTDFPPLHKLRKVEDLIVFVDRCQFKVTNRNGRCSGVVVRYKSL